MDQITKIKELIYPVIVEKGVQLYDVTWVKEGSMNILQVAIMNEDGSMDIEVCAEVSELISPLLDEADLISIEYYLEVCSPGAERELRTFEEVKKAEGGFVFAQFHNTVKNIDEVKGTLVRVDEDQTMLFEYMDKAVKRKCETNYANVRFIRMSVKI